MANGSVQFEAQVAPHRRALVAYSYRMLGSWSDAEDAVQEALVRAWKSLDALEGRDALRSWLFQIATRTCLDLLAQRKRRHLPDEVAPAAQPGDEPRPDPLHDYIEPAPASALDLEPGPETVVSRRQSVALAFLVTLQALPATQRAALVLKDVMGFSAEETAKHLDTTVAAVNSLLQRARASLDEASPRWARRASEEKERDLLGRYLRVWESSDVAGLISLLREDATLTMPPMALWFRGLEAITGFLGTALFAPAVDAQRFKAVPVEAAGHLGLAISMRNGPGTPWEPAGVHLVEAEGDRLVHVVAWVDPKLTARFLAS
jgi:RNA polymerase sigma-70 factor (ECF subfamily)